MYEDKSFKNTFGINKITLYKKIHSYCRLGGDWYTNQLTISFNPMNEIPDYIFIDKAIEEKCEKQDLLIEEVISNIYNIIKDQVPSATNIHIESYIDDSIPKNMPVKVELIDGV